MKICTWCEPRPYRIPQSASRTGLRLVAIAYLIVLCTVHAAEELAFSSAEESSTMDDSSVNPAALDERLRRFHLHGLDPKPLAHRHRGRKRSVMSLPAVALDSAKSMEGLHDQLSQLQKSEEEIENSIDDNDASIDSKRGTGSISKLAVRLPDADTHRDPVQTVPLTSPVKKVVVTPRLKLDASDTATGAVRAPMRQQQVVLGAEQASPEPELRESQSEDKTTAAELKAQIAQMKQADEAIAEERKFAEQKLQAAIKSGKEEDLVSARQMMSEVQQKTALGRLNRAGYTCQHQQGPADLKKSSANGTASAKNSTVAGATKTSLGHIQSAVVLLEDEGTHTKDDADPASKAYDAVSQTNDKLEDFEFQISNSMQAIADAKEKTKNVQVTAAKRAVTVTKKAESEVKGMQKQVANMKKEHAILKNIYAAKKLHDAQDYVHLVEGQLEKGKVGMTTLREEGTKLRAKAKVAEEVYMKEKEVTDNLKQKAQDAKLEGLTSEADEVFAEELHRSKEATSYMAEQGRENTKNMNRLVVMSQRNLKIPRDKHRAAAAAVTQNKKDLWKAEGIQHRLKKQLIEGKNEVLKAREENHAMFKKKFMADESSSSAGTSSAGASQVSTEIVPGASDSENDKAEVMTKARAYLQEVVSSGDANKLADAMKLLASIGHASKTETSNPSQAVVSKPCEKTNDEVDKKNPAKCAGESHGMKSGEGKLECKPKKGTCPDSVGGTGMFVLTKPSGEGFCAPWYDPSGNSTTREFVFKVADKQNTVLGTTYITKSSVIHPEGASPKVGVILFKRIVCEGEKCHEYKAERCIQCDEDVFKSLAPKGSDEPIQFLKGCALPLLKKHKDTLPKENKCQGSDLVKANRISLGF